MKSKTVWLATAAAIISGAGLAGAAQAQEAAPGDIVVTARKIAESVQDIPMSITAISADQIDKQGLENLSDISRVTPGFAFQDFNGGFPTPVIRGQSQTRLTNPVQNVATNFNGIYLQRGYEVDSSLLGVDRVEVLRGPQSAALGRNAFAGAVNFITKTPKDKVEADLSASYGENDYQKYSGLISGPIAEGVLRGIAGYTYSEYDGSWKNSHALANAGGRTDGNLGGYEKSSWLLGLNFTPTDALRFDLTYTGSDRDTETPAGYVLGSGTLEAFDTNNCSPNAFARTLFCGVLPVAPTLAPGEPRKPGYVVDPRTGVSITSDIVSFAGNWDISDAWSLNYLYGHAEGTFEGAGVTNRDAERGYTSFLAGLFGFGGQLLADNTGNGGIKADSHEVRLNYKNDNGLNAYLGLYQSSTDDRTKGVGALLPAQTTGPLSPGVLSPFGAGFSDTNTETDVESVFGFVEYATGPWTVSLEARQTHEEQQIFDRNVVGAALGNAKKSFNYFTPRGTINFALSDNNSIYASVGKGVKSGGFNAGGSQPATFANPAQATYGIEENVTYEIGTKNEFLDRKLVLNAALYYIDTTGLQTSQNRVVAAGTAGTVIANVGDAQTWGLELEANYKATEALNLYAGLGYSKAEYGDNVFDVNNVAIALCDNIVCKANGDISGNRIERSPDWTGNVGFSFDHNLVGDYDYFVRGNVSYTGQQFINNTNVGKIDSYVVTDASIGVTKGGFEAKLSADNLFDEEYVSSAFNTQFLVPSIGLYVYNTAPFLGDRRKVAFTLSYKY